jgi:hypothetical protein
LRKCVYMCGNVYECICSFVYVSVCVCACVCVCMCTYLYGTVGLCECANTNMWNEATATQDFQTQETIRSSAFIQYIRDCAYLG